MFLKETTINRDNSKGKWSNAHALDCEKNIYKTNQMVNFEKENGIKIL